MKGSTIRLIVFLWPALSGVCAGAEEPGPAVPGMTGPLEISAMFMNDWASFIDAGSISAAMTEGDPDAADPFIDGTEFRRARLGFSGPLGPHLELKLEYDFGSGQAEPADVYLEVNDLPLVGTVRVGHQYEPLNRLSGSSRNLVFLEKPLPNAFSSGRNVGLRTLSTGWQKRMTLSAGAYRDTDETGANGENKAYNLAARLTALPFYRTAGRGLGHLGVFYSRRTPHGSAVRFRQRPEAHLAPYLVDTGAITASAVDVFGLEAAAIAGPASLQAEYIEVALDETAAGRLRFSGYYITAAWVLTGEHRPYSRINGGFTRFEPRRPFDPSAGAWGAWMLLARYSHLDLNDEPVRGGLLADLSIGLNWYLSSQTRLMWNYIFADAEDLGDLQIAQMRLQVEL
ncbi:MAG: porin [Candidatus Eisenbacteria bacterium]